MQKHHLISITNFYGRSDLMSNITFSACNTPSAQLPELTAVCSCNHHLVCPYPSLAGCSQGGLAMQKLILGYLMVLKHHYVANNALLISTHFCTFLYPPKRSLVYWIHPVRPSVRPSVRPWVGVRMITLILFSGFKNFFLHISLGSRSCMGLNISVLPH